MGMFSSSNEHKPIVAQLGTYKPWVQQGLALTWGSHWKADAVKGSHPDSLLTFKVFIGWVRFVDAAVAHKEEMKEINDKIAEAQRLREYSIGNAPKPDQEAKDRAKQPFKSKFGQKHGYASAAANAMVEKHEVEVAKALGKPLPEKAAAALAKQKELASRTKPKPKPKKSRSSRWSMSGSGKGSTGRRSVAQAVGSFGRRASLSGSSRRLSVGGKSGEGGGGGFSFGALFGQSSRASVAQREAESTVQQWTTQLFGTTASAPQAAAGTGTGAGATSGAGASTEKRRDSIEPRKMPAPGDFVTESHRMTPSAKRLSVFRSRKSVTAPPTTLFEEPAPPVVEERPKPPSQPPKRTQVMDECRKQVLKVLESGGAPIETDTRMMQEALDRWVACGAPLSDSTALVMVKVYGAKPPGLAPIHNPIPRRDPQTESLLA